MWIINTLAESDPRVCLSLPPSALRHHAAPALSIIGAKEDWGSTTVPQSVQK